MHEANLRLMTFNIRGSEYDRQRPNQWTNRAPLNLRTIRRAAPALMGLQEAHAANLALYEQALPEYRCLLGPPADHADRHAFNPIYWQPTQLELRDSGGFYLSLTPDCWSRDWDAACVRAATWARLFWPAGGTELLVLNTHFDHIGETARLEGCRVLLRLLEQINTPAVPVVVLGDFNCSPWMLSRPSAAPPTWSDASYRLFMEHGFVDSFLAAGNVDSPLSNTYHGFAGDAYDPADEDHAWRIDWILVRGGPERRLTPTRSHILRDAEPPLYPSDHYPVVADVSLTP